MKTIKISKTIKAGKPSFKSTAKKLAIPKTIAKAKKPKGDATPTDKFFAVAGKNIPLAAVAEWKGEGTKPIGMAALAAKYGVKRGALKRAIVKAVGGKAKFKTLRSAGAGGEAIPFGGKRGKREPAAVRDAAVKMITRTDTKGWTHYTKVIRGVPTNVLVTDKQVEYIPAAVNERADLVYQAQKCSPACQHGKKCPGATLRLRLLETSSIVKKAKRKAELAAKGAQAHAAKRAVKKAKRVAKKGK